MNKYTEDFTTIPTEVIDKLTTKVKELGCTPIMICRRNNHPDEADKLFVVIGKYINPHPHFDGQYAVWAASVFDGKASLTQGYYHIRFTTALKLIGEKVYDFNKEEC